MATRRRRNRTRLRPVNNGYRETVSPDGSRILFKSAGQLYMRVNHTSTAWVSESENPAFTGEAEEVVLATDDG